MEKYKTLRNLATIIQTFAFAELYIPIREFLEIYNNDELIQSSHLIVIGGGILGFIFTLAIGSSIKLILDIREEQIELKNQNKTENPRIKSDDAISIPSEKDVANALSGDVNDPDVLEALLKNKSAGKTYNTI